MQITSLELWDSLEVSLIQLKNKNVDQILSEKVDSLINHFNGLIASKRQYQVIDEIRLITSTISHKNFFVTRNIDKEDTKLITSIAESLSLLEKVLIQEARNTKKEEPQIDIERLPNIDNDKSMNILKSVNE